MSRAVSTVVDVAFCLLLLSAAVVVLVTAAPPVDGGDAEPSETAASMATATTAVEYESGAGAELTRRGTLAELLAAAAVANATVDGEGPVGQESFVGAVQSAVAAELDETVPGNRIDTARRTQVRAVWRPQRGSGLRGHVVVGDQPPADADIETATLAIPIGNDATGTREVRERNSSDKGEGGDHRQSPGVRANRTLAVLVPRSAERPLSVRRPAPQAVARFDQLQTDLLNPSARVDSATNHDLAEERLHGALERRYRRADRTDNPGSIRIGVVEIVVRRWTV